MKKIKQSVKMRGVAQSQIGKRWLLAMLEAKFKKKKWKGGQKRQKKV